MSNLHVIREWEEAIPVNARFEHVFFNDKSEVTKVLGKILVSKIFENKIIKGYVKVHWDGFGRCYIGKVNRKKDKDIHFN